MPIPKVTAFHKSLYKDGGTFRSRSMVVSRDSVSWIDFVSIYISPEGAIHGENPEGPDTVLIAELASCHVEIKTSAAMAQSQKNRFAKKPDPDSASHDEPPVIFIRSYSNSKLYVRVYSRSQFGTLLSCLTAWQNMKPSGLAKKWFAQNRALYGSYSDADSHELLVCRFKIYGPIPAKAKNINVVDGPKAPVYQDEFDAFSHLNSAAPAESNATEGWFYTMGVLKSNGILHFITELDGTLLYSMDIRQVFSSEIREVHHSIGNSPNTLFIGHIRELRLNNVIKTTSMVTPETIAHQSLLTKDGVPVANNQRILIEFPLHIDLEDWFVGLNYFCKREYLGVYNKSSVREDPKSTRVVGLEATLDLDSNDSPSPQKPQPMVSQKPKTDADLDLSLFTKDHFRVSKRVTLDIIEAKFEKHNSLGEASSGKIYAEVIMWGFAWSKTSAVNYTSNPFWKEQFSTDLPISTQMLRIVIKKCARSTGYSSSDAVVGTVYITPDILTQKLRSVSTMMIANGGDEMSIPGSQPINNSFEAASPAPQSNNNIVRMPIYDMGNLPIGKLLLTVDLKEYLIPPSAEFRALENMLFDCPMKELIEHCNNTVGTSEFENVSFILLDIFQSLGIEDKWFKALMEVELVVVDEITRKNYTSKSGNASQTKNIFNTLFRGSSIFTKSLEKYIFRIGQEYLEKVFGNFFETICSEQKNCEIDPRYVRMQENAKRKGKNIFADEPDSDSEESDSDDDSDADVEKEKAFDAHIDQVVDANFRNLYGYAEDIWQRIYTTSNDLPQQIKSQLKNLRTKVDLACDPEDKTTSLNCLSAFVFLRFFCPAILNPKLFFLTKDHQTGNVQRTLTVIAKILLNLANRQEFSPHKEPHLVRMNEFLKRHEPEVYDYFDKLTCRKNDFNEKVLSLSHEMKRFDLGLSGESASSELPTTPYLIDKYLRLTEFIHLLHGNGNPNNRVVSSGSNTSLETVSGSSPSKAPMGQVASTVSTGPDRVSVDYIPVPKVLTEREKDVYQIGSLEFEKYEFTDLAGDDSTDGFIKSLCRSNEEIFSFINSKVTMKDVQKQSTAIYKRIYDSARELEPAEKCSNLSFDPNLWKAFVNSVFAHAYLDMNKHSIAFRDPNFRGSVPHEYRKLVDGLASMKLKFPTEGPDSDSFSSSSLGAKSTKNPFKRWLKR